jgi:hypothetical protein
VSGVAVAEALIGAANIGVLRRTALPAASAAPLLRKPRRVGLIIMKNPLS